MESKKSGRGRLVALLRHEEAIRATLVLCSTAPFAVAVSARLAPGPVEQIELLVLGAVLIIAAFSLNTVLSLIEGRPRQGVDDLRDQ